MQKTNRFPFSHTTCKQVLGSTFLSHIHSVPAKFLPADDLTEKNVKTTVSEKWERNVGEQGHKNLECFRFAHFIIMAYKLTSTLFTLFHGDIIVLSSPDLYENVLHL